MLIKHQQLMMKSTAQPSSSDADTPCNWCALEPQHICQVQVQHSDLHSTNASMSSHLLRMLTEIISWWLISCASQIINHCFMWCYRPFDCFFHQCTGTQYCPQICITPMQHKWVRESIINWCWIMMQIPAGQPHKPYDVDWNIVQCSHV